MIYEELTCIIIAGMINEAITSVIIAGMNYKATSCKLLLVLYIKQ